MTSTQKRIERINRDGSELLKRAVAEKLMGNWTAMHLVVGHWPHELQDHVCNELFYGPNAALKVSEVKESKPAKVAAKKVAAKKPAKKPAKKTVQKTAEAIVAAVNAGPVSEAQVVEA